MDIYEKILSFNDIHECEPELMMFGDCELKEDIGPFKKGDKVDMVSFFAEKGTMEVQQVEGGEVLKFNISIQIGEQIKE